MKWLNNLWDKLKLPTSLRNGKTPVEHLKLGECAFCQKKDLLSGPEGAGAVNVICGSCGARYNFTILGVKLQRIPARITEQIPEVHRFPSIEVTQARIDKIEAVLTHE